MLLKTTMYLDLHIFHMRDHKDRSGQETGNLRKQFENSENFSFIFELRKQQETINCIVLNLERHFFDKISLNFWFLSSMSARSRRSLANLEEKNSKID